MTNFKKFKIALIMQLESPEEWIMNNNDCSDCPAYHFCRYDLNHENERHCKKAFLEWANREAK